MGGQKNDCFLVSERQEAVHFTLHAMERNEKLEKWDASKLTILIRIELGFVEICELCEYS